MAHYTVRLQVTVTVEAENALDATCNAMEAVRPGKGWGEPGYVPASPAAVSMTDVTINAAAATERHR